MRVHFPELEHLPPTERQAILRECATAATVQRLQARRLWATRAILCLIPVGIALYFVGNNLGWDMQLVVRLQLAIMATVVTAVPALFFWYLTRTRAELRRLVRQKLEQTS
jgi:hypothetical protein